MEIGTGGPSKGTPMENRIRQDFNYLLIRFAESFVGNDELRKQVLMEELSKFRSTNRLELDNIALKEELKRKDEELRNLQHNTSSQKTQYDSVIKQLKRDLDNEKKDRMIIMNQMIKSMEMEKNTRVRAYAFLTQQDLEGEMGEFENKTKDRLAQNADDVEFYKAKLLEKISYIEDEYNLRVNMRNFNKRISFTEEGVKVFGTPRSLDHIYDLIGKLKQEVYPHKSEKRKAILEDIAVYVNCKQVSFLRHFGFAASVGNKLDQLETETQLICLFILSKLAEDGVLVQEMMEDDIYPTLRRFMANSDSKLRFMALKVLNLVSTLPSLHQRLSFKVALFDKGNHEFVHSNGGVHSGQLLPWNRASLEHNLQYFEQCYLHQPSC